VGVALTVLWGQRCGSAYPPGLGTMRLFGAVQGCRFGVGTDLRQRNTGNVALSFSDAKIQFDAIVYHNSGRKKRFKKEGLGVFGVQESSVRAHKYQVGQTVYFTSGPVSRPGASGSYQILKLLPSDGSDYQYRIKSPAEAFERVAKESQLDRAG